MNAKVCGSPERVASNGHVPGNIPVEANRGRSHRQSRTPHVQGNARDLFDCSCLYRSSGNIDSLWHACSCAKIRPVFWALVALTVRPSGNLHGPGGSEKGVLLETMRNRRLAECPTVREKHLSGTAGTKFVIDAESISALKTEILLDSLPGR